jgi:molybdopterin-guanine dinucleotide biosynthesis protein B
MSTNSGPSGTPVIAIVGWKNSGKTTLAVRLIAEMTRRGRVVASVKHAHHSFEIDEPGTDSARHRTAGARQVAIVSSARVAMIKELGQAPEPGLADVLAMLDPCDLVIVEGYKTAPVAKIEVRRAAAASHVSLATSDRHVIAIAADHPTDAHGRPMFGLDDITALADLIEARLLRREATSAPSTRVD